MVLQGMQGDPDFVVGDARDSCATNGVAQRHLLMLCPGMEPGKCVSHLAMGTGQHIVMVWLGPFMADMLVLSSHSLAFKTAFKDAFGVAMKHYSSVRWWSRWELMEQLALNFGSMGKLLTSSCSAASVTRQQRRSSQSIPTTGPSWYATL